MNFLPATVEGDLGEASRSAPSRSPRPRPRRPRARALLIAGIRPEHFEDAAVMDAAEARRARRSRPRSTSTEWLGNEAYAYIPVRGTARGPARSCSSSSVTSTARRCARSWSSPSTARADQGGRRGRPSASTPSKMHLFDPGTRREPHRRQRRGRRDPGRHLDREGGRATGRGRDAGRAGGHYRRLSSFFSPGAGRRDTLTPPINAKPRMRTTGLFASSSGGVESEGPL